MAEIIGVVLVYALKALLEKRKDFGAVGLEEKDKTADEDTVKDL